MKSPFSYGSTVSGASFTNREDELERLKSNFSSGINTLLISPRRWGKSSLVEKAINSYTRRNKKDAIVLIDLFSINSQEEFLEIFAQEVIRASASKLEDWMSITKNFFKQLVPKLSMSMDPGSEFSLSFDIDEMRKHASEILNLPETIAKKKGIRFIICLDEFQQLAEIDDYEALERKMRASWQRHKQVSYCLFGSKQHMMESIFNDSSKPFYRFGELMLLDKIDRKKWLRYIQKGFSKTGREITQELAERIAASMEDHPWYVQQLAHYVWTASTEGEAVSKRIVDRAIAQVVYTNAPLFERELEVRSKTQTELLKAIYKGEKQLGGKKVAKNYQVGTSRNVSKNKVILQKQDIIYSRDGLFEFMDPVFKLWFGSKFYARPFTD